VGKINKHCMNFVLIFLSASLQIEVLKITSTGPRLTEKRVSLKPARSC